MIKMITKKALMILIKKKMPKHASAFRQELRPGPRLLPIGYGFLLILAVVQFSFTARAAESCKFRGSLDEAYCDEDRNMVADPPADTKNWRDPSTLVFAYTPAENRINYAVKLRPFLGYLEQCLGRRVIYFRQGGLFPDPTPGNTAQIDAMRTGRLHISGFTTGGTAFAVNLAGAIPFAISGNAAGFQNYRVMTIVKPESGFRTLADLKGRRVAHTTATSNSGNLVPRAFFPSLGLAPDKDYRVTYSGGHEWSILGVRSGEFEAAPVASNVFGRMVSRRQIKPDDFRIIWQSAPFPSSAFAFSHDLRPELSRSIRQCFLDYRFPETLRRELALDDNDRFWPADYAVQWAPVRAVADAVNAPYNRAAFDQESRREFEAEQRRKQRAQVQPTAQNQR